MSDSSANRTKPYPRERPVEGSHMTLADFVEGKTGVNRACSGERVSPRRRFVGRVSEQETHDQLGLAHFPSQVTHKHAVLSLPSRLKSGKTCPPVELEGSSRTRHERGRRRVKPREDLSRVGGGREREEAVA
jgi:hypothetical protein